MDTTSKLVVIVGPTSSGKTSLAIDIAKKYNGEIICADSRTIYKGMDIGTAKPTLAEQKEVKHHLLDIVEPGQKFTAAKFKELAMRAIEEINSRGKLSILVGGTGLYVDSVLFNYQFGSPADPERRQKLLMMSVESLQELCRKNNIELPENLQNKRHLVRAIELGGLNKRVNLKLRDNTIVVGITADNEVLRSRITKRSEAMFKQGVIDEAKLLSKLYGWESEAMTGNIYPIARRVIDGEITKEQAVEENVTADMRLAKRQRTWFKRNPHIFWSDDLPDLIDKVEQFIRS